MVTITAPLTPKSDQSPHIITIKAFWVHKKFWSKAEINNYQKEAPIIADRIQKAGVKHTCDKFALSVLIEFASKNQLPIKIKTGAGTFRNVALNNVEFNKFEPSPQGFSKMVLPHFTAHDVKNNAVALSSRGELRSGDIFLEDTSTSGHVQVVMSISNSSIMIKQGNFPDNLTAFEDRALGKIKSIFTGYNDSSTPGSSDYLGVPIQDGQYWQDKSGWHYKNITFNRVDDSWVKKMEYFMKWDFYEFNK